MSASDEILAFARCLYSKGDIVEWRAIKTPSVESGYCLAEELKDQEAILDKLNAAGMNIYVGANPRREKWLKGDASVDICRTIFVDFDGLDDTKDYDMQALDRIRQAGLPMPTMRVFSGHGVHCYWRLLAKTTPIEWSEAQARMIATLGSDRTIKNPERIMRLPGFENVKQEQKAPCFILDADCKKVCDITDLLDHCVAEIPPVPDSPTPVMTQKYPLLETKARAMLYAAKWPGCVEGERNNTAYLHACQMVNDFKVPEDETLDILKQWNAYNTPPLPDAELLTSLKSAVKGAKNPPGCKLADRPRKSMFVAPACSGATTSEAGGQVKSSVPETRSGEEPSTELWGLLESQMSGAYTNLSWPWEKLTEFGQCLTPATRTIIVGGTGGSKSLAILQALRLWVNDKIKCAVLELERGRDFHLARVLAQQAGIAELTKPKWVKANPDVATQLFQEHKDYLDKMGKAIHTVDRTFTIVQAAEWVEKQVAEGCRIIVLDPVTALTRGKESWLDDEMFISRIEKASRSSGASLICVTHPKKGGTSSPDVDNIAGGAAWARFPDAVIWLESHEPKVSKIRADCGTDEQTHNRTVWLLKTRSGEGEHVRLAYRFQTGKEESDTGALTLKELGIIVKGKKNGS